MVVWVVVWEPGSVRGSNCPDRDLQLQSMAGSGPESRAVKYLRIPSRQSAGRWERSALCSPKVLR